MFSTPLKTVLLSALLTSAVGDWTRNAIEGLDDLVLDSGQVNAERLEELGTTLLRQSQSRGDRSKVCDICAAAVKILAPALEDDENFQMLEDAAYRICVNQGAALVSERVCNGTFTMMVPIFHYAVVPTFAVAPYSVCDLIPGFDCGKYDHPWFGPSLWWDVDIPEGKPPISSWPVATGGEAAKVLVLTDLHIDMNYVAGSSAESCGEPLCCRDDSAWLNTSVPAGEWGSWKCGTPFKTLTLMLEDARSREVEIAAVYMLGDLLPHDGAWNNNQTEYEVTIDITLAEIARVFPGVPVFPGVGNHDTIPVNNFPPVDMPNRDELVKKTMYATNQWVYDKFARTWVDYWLDDELESVIKFGGYYSIPSPIANLQIVAINDNFCNDMNWWTLLDPSDPAVQLGWLVEELLQAEQAGRKVHILGHIPTGIDECVKVWSWNYYKIVQRFEGTIMAQFFGHEHEDRWTLYYDETASRPLSVAFVNPPGTAYSFENSAYRFFDLDRPCLTLTDYHTYYLDLAEVATTGLAQFRLEYSAKSTFQLVDLSPASFHSLTRRLQQDDDLFRHYLSLHYVSVRPEYHECTSDEWDRTSCREEKLCDLVRGRSYEPSLCLRVLGPLEEEITVPRCSDRFSMS